MSNTTILDNHRKTLFSRKIFIFKELYKAELKQDGDMEEHINSIIKTVGQLIDLGEKIKDNEVIKFLLCSLPKSYDEFIRRLKCDSEHYLDFTSVKDMLINEFKTRQQNKAQLCCSYCLKLDHTRNNCLVFDAHGRQAIAENKRLIDRCFSENSKSCRLNKQEKKRLKGRQSV